MCHWFLLLACAALLFVRLDMRLLRPSATFPVRAIIRGAGLGLCCLSTGVHHLEDLLVVRGIRHGELLGYLIFLAHLLVDDGLVLLLVVCALVSLVMASAGPVICLLSLALVLCTSSRLLFALFGVRARPHSTK